MQYIKAPFNFVPVSNQVFFPGWADQISHDMPFSDGLSGQLTVELKAETPIFVRDSVHIEQFCHVGEGINKKYFIPGTSLKGTIRSVLEILSFAKMDRINDHKFAIRDLHNEIVYTLMGDSENIRCGWLTRHKDENGVETATIRDCDIPWRISHKKLDDKLKTQFVSTFKKFGTAFKPDRGTTFLNEKYKTAFLKDSLLSGNAIEHNFAIGSKENNKQLCNFSANTKDPKGKIVLTGQAGASKEVGDNGNILPGKLGKFFEFVFIEPKQTNTEPIQVDAKTWSEFKFHYLDHDPKHISADWEWRRGQLNAGKEIPVFFRINENDREFVKDLGLAYLYKMPYAHSVKEFLPEEHRLGFFKPDLAECIFGFVHEQDALKGRVQFTSAWAEMDTAHEGPPIDTVLGSPKASYYPIYIKQKGSNGSVDRLTNGKPKYKTYMEKGSEKEPTELAGRKRYPVVESELRERELPNGTDDMGVKFTPLKKEAKFIAIINYFNLRPVELGALLSALTFHNNASECYHGLGMAKPYGFGRVALSITDKVNMEEDIEYYLKAFESAITAYLKVDNPEFQWHESTQIKEFIAMAKVQKFLDDNGQPNIQAQRRYKERLKYMKLIPDQKINEFADAKADEKMNNVVVEQRGFYLEKYTKIVSPQKSIVSFADSKKVEEEKLAAEHLRKQLKEDINNFKILEELRILEVEKKKVEKKLKAEEKNRLKAMQKIEEEHQKRLDEFNQREKVRQDELDKIKQEVELRNSIKSAHLKELGLEPLIDNISDFEKAKKVVDAYMKRIKVTQLNDKDSVDLLKMANDWYQSTPPKAKEKRWKPTNGPDWKKIDTWVGPDLAQKWYNDLISGQ